MQHQFPYSFSFLSEVGGLQTHLIMVCMENTRSKKQVVKVRNFWDEEASTKLVIDPELNYEKFTIMEQSHYFWNCMRYAAAKELLDYFLVDELTDREWAEAQLILPKPCLGEGPIEYTKLLNQTFPRLNLADVDNGF